MGNKIHKLIWKDRNPVTYLQAPSEVFEKLRTEQKNSQRVRYSAFLDVVIAVAFIVLMGLAAVLLSLVILAGVLEGWI